MTHHRLICLIATALMLTACAHAKNSIYWSDGDSGRLNGVPFRLANVDAPETGGIGSRGGAKCEAERVLGYEVKAFMVELTRDAIITIEQTMAETATIDSLLIYRRMERT